MKTSIKFLAGATVALLLGTTSLHANQVTVQELAFDPGVRIAEISVPYLPYTGGVYAGINHLLVSGTTMNGFCIDPFHFSSTSPLLYTVVSLDHAPKPPGTMNSTQASEISMLWGEYYNLAAPSVPTPTSELIAAGMQIAIWEIVAGNQMTITPDPVYKDFGAAYMLASLATYTGASADLVGLTGPGQDYVVQRTPALRVPDHGSTLALLGLALMALLASGARQNKISRSVLGC